MNAGLPNITGIINQYFTTANGDADGPFLLEGYKKFYATPNGTSQGLNTLNFNASLSNPIYGNSTTVTPLSLKSNFFLKF